MIPPASTLCTSRTILRGPDDTTNYCETKGKEEEHGFDHHG